jgi:hypothetical protein
MDRREYRLQWFTSFDEKTMTATIDDGENEPIEVKCKYVVCEVCNGKGSHVNPSIDSHGLSREDFDEDPDFRENYFSGMYDVPCNECKGSRVLPEPIDETPENIKNLIENRIRDEMEYNQLCAMERKMGC